LRRSFQAYRFPLTVVSGVVAGAATGSIDIAVSPVVSRVVSRRVTHQMAGLIGTKRHRARRRISLCRCEIFEIRTLLLSIAAECDSVREIDCVPMVFHMQASAVSFANSFAVVVKTTERGLLSGADEKHPSSCLPGFVSPPLSADLAVFHLHVVPRSLAYAY
jgi:hypothetical protein